MDRVERILNILISTQVKLLGALPAVDVVAQPEVKVVVSHCGAGAAQEALYFGKPLLCVPFFGDQADVGARVADAGAGLVLEKHALSDARVRAAVDALATNATYARNAARVADDLRAAGGVDAAADALEKWLGVAAPGGAAACDAEDAAAPWHRENHLDAYALYVALLVLTGLGFASATTYILT